MSYLYYPGCSLTGTAKEYDISTRAFMNIMDMELTEIPDWTCCGASAATATDRLLSFALPAINLAIAENTSEDDILVPCSACYLNLKKVEDKTVKDEKLLKKINKIIGEKNLEYKGRTRTRHILDILSKDVGPYAVKNKAVADMSGFTIAPYYGCQCLRPYAGFDNPENPVSMEPLIHATGAKIHSWRMGGKCCGASHMNTKMDVAFELVYGILKAAKGADAIVTVCPMCQMNLEAYQKKISLKYNDDVSITILYLPQLLGLGAGLSVKELGIDLNLSVQKSFLKKLTGTAKIGKAA